MAFLESKFGCSGICESGLFYFSQPITKGPPTGTCLNKIRVYVQENSNGLGGISTFTGLISLIVFLMHFNLYGKETFFYQAPPQQEAAQLPDHSNVSELQSRSEIQLEDIHADVRRT